MVISAFSYCLSNLSNPSWSMDYTGAIRYAVEMQAGQQSELHRGLESLPAEGSASCPAAKAVCSRMNQGHDTLQERGKDL